MTESSSPANVDSSAPHSARVWNYLLGGHDNFPVDREMGDQILRMFPAFAAVARAQRAFLTRAVRFLAGAAGVRQFLDIGSGLPTADNTHEVAQRAAPDCKIVYVDNDPLVLVHAQALLTGTSEGATAYVHADVREPDRILEAAAATLDFTEPVALVMLSIMGQLPDEDDPSSILRQLLAALPAGSYLALSDGIDTNESLNAAVSAYNANSASSYHLRGPEQIAGFFEGLELVEPGVVMTTKWRPDAVDVERSAPQVAMCGVGRKP